ncbi:pumilio homolog 2-like isoform X2 [Ornithodoros turicata]|uniref:pumilio homolog 2-like isoform X2 n=1 Tax=Ornithodoros turicata TaxID=34597 RepID=UPI003139F184
MLANGQEMNPVSNVRHGATRSQDDAMVGYFFQRPQSDPDFQNYNKQSRWALGDDSVLEARGTEAAELETEFQALALETSHHLEIPASTKKLWALEETGAKPEDSKGIFLGDQWRDPTWSTGHTNTSGSDGASMLSPRSSETSGLGVKMVEYVLGSSPTIKDLDSRMGRMHMGPSNGDPDKVKKSKEHKMKDTDGGRVVMQANGIIHNGIDDDKGYKNHYHRSPVTGYGRGGSRQSSPSEDMGPKGDKMGGPKGPPMGDAMAMAGGPQGGCPPGLEAHHFEHHGGHVDQLSFEYPGMATSHGLMQSMDSPGILDYAPQMYQQHQQQSRSQHQGTLPMLPGGQYQIGPAGAGHHQQGAAGAMGVPPGASPFAPPPPSNPYIMNQDPYAPPPPMGIMTGPAMMAAQYYGMPPWGMFPTPAGLLQGQGGQGGPPPPQQMLRSSGARPMTPQGGEALSQGGAGMPTQGLQAPGGQYQMLAPPYYDQNGSLMMGNTRAMRLMPPVLVNPGGPGGNPASQPASMNGNNLRLLGSQGPGGGGGPQQGSHQGSVGGGLFSSGGNGPATASNHLFSTATSGGYSGAPSSFSGGSFASTTGLGMGYGSSSLGPIGTSPVGPIGMSLGTESPRRDSLERRDAALLGGSGSSRGGPFAGALEPYSTGGLMGGPKRGSSGFYGPLGTVAAASPGPLGTLPPSLTPPPSLNGSSSNLNLGSFGGRVMSAAPGAEAKYMVRNGPLANVIGSSNSLVPSRTVQRNSSLEKPPGRSRLLEDFRNNRYPNLQLRDLANHIVEFSQDQHGSRFIQQKLERATPSEKQLVFSEILNSAYGLMTDVFGNYVIQKFFEFGSPDQKQALAVKVKGHVLPLALQMYGCRVIQKALESIPSEQQKEVVKELDGHVLKCVKDQNGNHVVQKCIECVEPSALQFVINAFQGQVFGLSTHPYGCRVIQRILEHCTGEQTCPVLEELHQHTEQLVQDQYGNYVVQHVLEHGRPDDKAKIVAIVRGKVLQLSQHKFASNVVEKCVTHASRAERAMLIEEVCSFLDGSHSALYIMMKDQYANYVVQKMIEVAEPPQRKLLLHKIRPHVPSLRKYTYGKHILAKLEKFLLKNNEQLLGGPSGSNGNGPVSGGGVGTSNGAL